MLNWIANIIITITVLFVIVITVAGMISEPRLAIFLACVTLAVWAFCYKAYRDINKTRANRKQTVSFGIEKNDGHEF